MSRLFLTFLVFACCSLSFAEDTLEEMIKKTDMNSADSVFMLGEWCEKNNKPSTARKYFTKVLQIDKDHEATRVKFGQVKVGDRWVAGATAGGGDAVVAGGTNKNGAIVSRKSSTPGPTVKDIKWDLAVPPAERGNKFIEMQIGRMQKSTNDGNDMESAVLTLYREDNRQEMIPLLCAALMRSDFTDLYGTSLLIMKFLKDHNKEVPRQLLGFVDQASERCKDKEDLEMFAYIAPLMKDRRIIPRLIELMGHSEALVSTAARRSFAQMSLQPDSPELTKEKAKKWWDDNHDISPKVFLSEQLQSNDPIVVIIAAEGLFELREKSLVPAVIKVLAGDNRRANEKGIQLITRITGNDWGYSPTASPADRAKVVEQLNQWWKKNGTNFEWVVDRDAKPEAGAATSAKDPLAMMVNQLASVEGNDAQQAEQNLMAGGNDSVPALLAGLKNPSVIVRRKSNDILKSLSKKDVGYDPRADEIARDKSIKAWTEWAKAEDALGEEKTAQ